MIDNPEVDRQKLRVRMLIPLWGASYFERWMNISAASLCSKGNIPYLQEHTDFELVFLTKSQDLDYVTHTIAPQVGDDIAIRTVTIDEFFPKNTPVSYAVPLTLAFMKGIRSLGAEGIGSFVILMNADFVLSDGSLARLLQCVKQGYHIITAPSLRVVDQSVRNTLSMYLRGQKAKEGLPARYLMSLAQEHLHQTILARIINEPELIEAWYYHLVYWRVSKNCLAARYFLLMPLCFQLRRQVATATCPIDYGFVEQVCPGGRYRALSDSDEFLMVELQDRDSEVELLMPSSITTSRTHAVEQKLTQIVANAGAWSTYEHRRAFKHTLLFHSDDLSGDDDVSLSAFDTRMSQVLDQMPPPVPRQRHMHWLGAVHHYRKAMTVDKMPYPELLLDDANRITVALVARQQALIPSLQQAAPIELAKYFTSLCAVVTLEYLAPDIAGKVPLALLFAADVQDAHNDDQCAEFTLHEGPEFAPGRGLGMYLLTDTLVYWQKFRFSCDSAISAGAEVVLVFRNNSWTEVPFEGHGWIVSYLANAFPPEKYSAQLEFISAAPKHSERNKVAILSGIEAVVAQLDGGSVSPLASKTFVGFTVRVSGAGLRLSDLDESCRLGSPSENSQRQRT